MPKRRLKKWVKIVLILIAVLAIFVLGLIVKSALNGEKQEENPIEYGIIKEIELLK